MKVILTTDQACMSVEELSTHRYIGALIQEMGSGKYFLLNYEFRDGYYWVNCDGVYSEGEPTKIEAIEYLNTIDEPTDFYTFDTEQELLDWMAVNE